MKMSKFQLMASVLTVCLAVSLGFNIYQFLDCNGETSVTKTFTRHHKTYIRPDGVVRINATFDWSGSNLTITIQVNDDEYCSHDYIGLVFDRNKDGSLFDEVAFLLGAGNKTSPFPSGVRLEDWGGLIEPPFTIAPKSSPWHTCTFTEDEGYTFDIEMSKAEINFTIPMLTHLCFFDQDAYRWTTQMRAVVWFEFEV